MASCLPVINLLNVERLKELNISDPPCSQGESCAIDMVLEPRADERGAVAHPFIPPLQVKREFKGGSGGVGEVAHWAACESGLGSLGPMLKAACLGMQLQSQHAEVETGGSLGLMVSSSC